MIKLLAIVAAANLSGSSLTMPTQWTMWLTESSMAGTSGVYLDSAGRNVSADSFTSPDQAVAFWRGEPVAFCQEMPLSAYHVRTFAFRIASIPQDVLEGGHLTIRGDCNDELNLGVSLKLNGEVHYFGYSDIESCRDGKEVPSWLTTLVMALRARNREITDCAATASSATSVP